MSKLSLKMLMISKKKIKNSLTGRDLTLHFDGKAVTEFTDGSPLNQERIAVIVSSPSLQSPQVLGVPPAKSSKGVDQLGVVVKLLEEWQLKEFIMAIGFDTTASNTAELCSSSQIAPLSSTK